jgi:Tol biopolymer transport system component
MNQAAGPLKHLKSGGAPWKRIFRRWDPRYKELERILATKVLSPQLQRLLRFLVIECLEGRAAGLNEDVIAARVFQQRDFVASEKSVVRVEKHRLRERLREYYEEEGRNDPLAISLGASFVPVFARREAAAPARRGRRLPRQRAMAAALIVVVLGAWWWWRRQSPEDLVLTRLTYDSGLTTDPAISPDGKLLAYASDRSGEGNLDIWVQNIATGDRVLLAPNPADDYQPAFSPDGSKVAFRSDRDGGGIYVVAVLGGDLKLIARGGRGPRFSPDGHWIVYWVGEPYFVQTQVYVVPAAGGAPRPVCPQFYGAHDAIWSSDGSRLLLWGQRSQSSDPDWWVVPASGGQPHQTGAFRLFAAHRLSVSGPAAWVGDQVYFSGHGDTTNLWRVSLPPQKGEIGGSPHRLTFGTAQEDRPAVASDGTVVFSSAVSSANVWTLPADSNRGKPVGEMLRLTRDQAMEVFPSISENGKLVFNSDRSGTREIWVKDLKGGTETMVAASAEDYDSPKVTPDGARLAYAASAPRWTIHVLSLAGGEEKVFEDGGPPRAFSSDGTKLLYEAKSCSPFCAGLLDLTTGKTSHLISHPRYALYPESFSPDDRWVAFQVRRRDNDPARILCVVPFQANPLEQDWIAVTDGATMDREAKWSPDGSLIYYISERDGFRCLWAQRLDGKTKRPQGAPFAVQHFHHSRQSLNFGSPGKIGFSVLRDRLLFSLSETNGNVWTARRR